jgi:hypothetical protein
MQYPNFLHLSTAINTIKAIRPDYAMHSRCQQF